MKNKLIIPVSLRAGVPDRGLVGVGAHMVDSILNSWRTPTGQWLTYRWRPTPPLILQTLKLIWDLRQEAIRTAEAEQTHT